MLTLLLPGTLDYQNIEAIHRGVAKGGNEAHIFNARHLSWVDPNGMLGLLAAGTVVAKRSGVRPKLELPESEEVQSYLYRMDFFTAAAKVFELPPRHRRRQGPASDVLLEITSIETNSDVHEVVERVQSRAEVILAKTLRYPPSAVINFSVVLSEVCQNIIEHADAPGWVAAQSYNWTKRLGRQVVVISVCDLGRGFTASLADKHAERFGDNWGDATALEAAFLHGSTRFQETGRGQGIKQIRKQVARWNGLVSIRSGTARVADIPDWTRGSPKEVDLPHFPGSQINIILPERANA